MKRDYENGEQAHDSSSITAESAKLAHMLREDEDVWTSEIIAQATDKIKNHEQSILELKGAITCHRSAIDIIQKTFGWAQDAEVKNVNNEGELLVDDIAKPKPPRNNSNRRRT